MPPSLTTKKLPHSACRYVELYPAKPQPSLLHLPSTVYPLQDLTALLQEAESIPVAMEEFDLLQVCLTLASDSALRAFTSPVCFFLG